MQFLLDRIREPSTFRGLVFLATAAGVQIDPAQTDALMAIGLALAGLIDAFKKG